MSKGNNAGEFYEGIAGYYDAMTQFAKRLKRERAVIRRWIKKYHFREVLDLACGTGLHTILLNQLAVKASGADPSTTLLKKARSHARDAGLKIRFFTASFQNIAEKALEKYNTVLILGNSLAHILTREELNQSFQQIANVMRGNAKLIIQILNFTRICNQKERIIAVTKSGKQEYIRFYDFLDPLIRFNILHVDWHKNAGYSLNSTLLYPYTISELTKALQENGFTMVEAYGAMNFEEYHPEKSKDLIIVCKKEGSNA